MTAIVRARALVSGLLLLMMVSVACPLPAQTTVGTGSIVGIVSDPSDAAIRGAAVTVTNVATKQVIGLSTNSAGWFNSRALSPGTYKTMVAAKRFDSTEVAVTVLVGNTSTVNVKLRIGNVNDDLSTVEQDLVSAAVDFSL
jgi:Carboxypeptidase regulatory-like domain